MAATHHWQGAGVTLAGDSWGDPADRPALLLHGAGQTRHSWRSTGERLAEQGWYVTALDLRGHGDSHRSGPGYYRLGDFAADVCAIRTQLTMPPVLIGASLGGFASLAAVAAGGAQTASALVLVDISVHVEATGSEKIVSFMTGNSDGFESLEAAASAIAAFDPGRPRRPNVNGLRRNLRQRADGRWVWHWDPRLMDGSPRSIAHRVQNPETGRMELAHHGEAFRAAHHVRVPTLLIRGMRSELVSERSIRVLREVIPHATYVDVADAGHMIVGDRNDRFTAALLDYLGGQSTKLGLPVSGSLPMTPSARSRPIAVASRPSSPRTSSLCSPSRGAAVRAQRSIPAKRNGNVGT
jgi:pimeloyl-ACP methyl ester carboxylesterase